MKTKKILSVLLAICMILSIVPVTVFAGATSFTDVAKGEYYHDAVIWAVGEGITNGTGDGTTFSPAKGCSREEVVTFLWRAAGKPKVNVKNPFTDVPAGEYYTDAVLWAYKNGITTGKTATAFHPKDTCTRGEIVTFLYRYNKCPDTKTSTNPFKDIAKKSFYYDAVLWAYENDITTGKTAAAFCPEDTCTRAEIVTFLYRNLTQKEEAPPETEPTKPSDPTEPTEKPVKPSEPTEPTEKPEDPSEPSLPEEPSDPVTPEPEEIVIDAISDVELTAGTSADVVVVTAPADAVISAQSGSETVAGVTVSGHTLQVTGVAEGTAVITVMASTEGYKDASKTFTVTVEPKPVITFNDLSPMTLTEGGEAGTVTLTAAAGNGNAVTFAAVSGNPAVTVSVSGNLLTVTPVAEGEATITVTASAEGCEDVVKTFTVTVEPKPVITFNDLSPMTLTEGGEAGTVTLTAAAGNGNAVSFAAVSGNSAVTVSVSGNVLTVTPVAEGEATITVTAEKDGYSDGATQFEVVVVNGTTQIKAAENGSNIAAIDNEAKTITVAPYIDSEFIMNQITSLYGNEQTYAIYRSGSAVGNLDYVHAGDTLQVTDGEGNTAAYTISTSSLLLSEPEMTAGETGNIVVHYHVDLPVEERDELYGTFQLKLPEGITATAADTINVVGRGEIGLSNAALLAHTDYQYSGLDYEEAELSLSQDGTTITYALGDFRPDNGVDIIVTLKNKTVPEQDSTFAATFTACDVNGTPGSVYTVSAVLKAVEHITDLERIVDDASYSDLTTASFTAMGDLSDAYVNVYKDGIWELAALEDTLADGETVSYANGRLTLGNLVRDTD